MKVRMTLNLDDCNINCWECKAYVDIEMPCEPQIGDFINLSEEIGNKLQTLLEQQDKEDYPAYIHKNEWQKILDSNGSITIKHRCIDLENNILIIEIDL